MTKHTVDVASLLASGLGRHQRGDPSGAAAIYEQVLSRTPDNADALHLLGVARHQLGRSAEGAALIEAAIKAGSRHAATYGNWSEALRSAGQFAAAIKAADEAIRQDERFAEAWNNRGLALDAMGQNEQAAASFHRAIELKPRFALARLNLGALWQREGQREEAATCFREALAIDERLVEARNNLGLLAKGAGELAEAEQWLRSAVAIDPHYAAGWSNLAGVLRAAGRPDEALACYDRALTLDPSFVEALVDRAKLHKEVDRDDDARADFGAAIRRRPDPWLRLASRLVAPSVFADEAEIAAFRGQLVHAIEEFAEATPLVERRWLAASGVEPPFGLMLQGEDDRPIKEAWGRVFSQLIPFDSPAARGGRPKLAIVVTAEHEPVFIKSVVPILNRFREPPFAVTIVCPYSSRRLIEPHVALASVEWLAMSDRVDATARLAREASFDLVYHWEVGSDSTNYFLPYFAIGRRQVTSWGMQVTSGVPAMDGYVSSALAEPEVAETHYSERLMTLGTLLSWERRRPAPATRYPRAAFGLPEDRPIYLAPSAAAKLHPSMDDLILGILDRDPSGIVVLLEGRSVAATVRLRERLSRRLGEVANRALVVPRQGGDAYASLLLAADVILDTPRFSGANTTYDALSFAKPIVTHPGRFHRGRYTMACLNRIGAREGIAATAEEYIAKAVLFGTEPDARHDYVARLSQTVPALFEDDAVAVAWQELLTREIERARST